MLPKERVLAVFEHRPVDKVPIYMGSISSRVASAVLGHEAFVGGGIQQWREATALWNGKEAHREFLERTHQDTLELVRALDLDYVRPSYWRLPQRPAERLDEYTFKYEEPDGSWRIMRFDSDTELYSVVDWEPRREPGFEDLEQQVAEMEASLSAYKPSPEDFPDIILALKVYGNERAVQGTGVGIAIPREPIWLEAVVLRPDLVERLLDVQVERVLRNIEAQAVLGLRFMHGGGDFAGKHGPLYSPAAFRRFMLPGLMKISDACHKHGMFHMFASDGDLWPVADDLFARSGVDAYYEIDLKAGMDLAKLRQRFPHLTLLGGISSETLHIGSRDEVVAETLYALEVAKEYGSIIAGCSNLVVPGTPLENFWAMMETLHTHR